MSNKNRVPTDQHGCTCTHLDQSRGHLSPCKLTSDTRGVPLSAVASKTPRELVLDIYNSEDGWSCVYDASASTLFHDKEYRESKQHRLIEHSAFEAVKAELEQRTNQVKFLEHFRDAVTKIHVESLEKQNATLTNLCKELAEWMAKHHEMPGYSELLAKYNELFSDKKG